jgi:hypothetical protein
MDRAANREGGKLMAWEFKSHKGTAMRLRNGGEA